MKLPLQIRAHNLSISDAAKEEIRQKAANLDKFSNHVMGCRVTVDSPHRRHHQGMLYHVCIDLTLPGGEIVMKRQPHEDLYVAIRDAFYAARRKLETYERKRRGSVKVHEASCYARVIRLLPKEDFGFLETADGLEVYFHRNSVRNGAFNRLKIGTRVRYIEEPGEKGPQASTVMVVKKGRISGTKPKQ